MALQVNAGDIRVMMPCSKIAAAGPNSPQNFPPGLSGAATLADETMTVPDEAVEPTFLVAVFSGFSVSTQSAESRGPRPTRLSNLRSGISSIPAIGNRLFRDICILVEASPSFWPLQLDCFKVCIWLAGVGIFDPLANDFDLQGSLIGRWSILM